MRERGDMGMLVPNVLPGSYSMLAKALQGEGEATKGVLGVHVRLRTLGNINVASLSASSPARPISPCFPVFSPLSFPFWASKGEEGKGNFKLSLGLAWLCTKKNQRSSKTKKRSFLPVP